MENFIFDASHISTTYIAVKRCVRYIFASLIFMSKREHLWNKEECFLLDLEIFFRFRYSNVMTSPNPQVWNTKHILLCNLGSKHSLVMKFG